MKYIYPALAFTLLLNLQALSAQDLLDDWTFLHESRETYQDWLKSNDLSKVIRVVDLIVDSKIVILDLRVTNGTDWYSLRMRYEERYGIDLRRKLFKQMTFLFELDRDQAGIRIRSDASDHFVDMRYHNGELLIQETKPKGKRQDSLAINLNEIPGALEGDGDQTIALSKSKLRQYFEQYYQEESSFYRKVKYDIFDNEPNFLEFRIWNIKKEILDDLAIGYFEYISMDISLKVVNEQVKIYYDVSGKYGSGIFTAPRKSGYKEIDKYFDKDYMNDFQKRLTSRINDFLRKN